MLHILLAQDQRQEEQLNVKYLDLLVALVARTIKLFNNILLVPALLGVFTPFAANAGGEDHRGHKGHHSGHTNMANSYPSTMFMGKTTLVLGGVDGVSDSGMAGMSMSGTSSSEDKDGTVFHYDTKLMFMTSFTGHDMLKTAVRIGNFGMMEPFGMMGEARLDTGFSSNDSLELHKAYYQFPLGDNIELTFGPKLRQDDLLGVWPSAYPGDGVLFVLNQAGANDTYSKKMGAGAGITWSHEKIVASALFVSEDASNSSIGFFADEGKDHITAQVAWVDENFTLAAAFTQADNGKTDNSPDVNDYSSYGISGSYTFGNDYSVSAGLGWKNPDNEDDPDTAMNKVEDGNTWSVGFLWNDAFIEGNKFGFGIGTAETHRDDSGYDDPLAWEAFYDFKMNDSVTVTPAIFVIEKDGKDDVNGALVKTSFKF